MQCPKCQRPIDDSDAGGHVCCADASLRWRCAHCAQVSEGFAFAYGRCPHCGGKLEVLDSHRAGQVAALSGIRMAFEIELGGRAFYQRAAADTSDAVMRALFGRFAVMEGEHMEALSRRYHVDVPGPAPAFQVELAALFADVEHRPQDPDNLFRIAIGLEQRAAQFFDALADQASAGSADQRQLRELADEEREHAATLTAEYAHWQAGTPGRLVPAPAAGPQAAQTINAAALLLEGHDAARTALVCGSEQLDYGALRERVARAAAVWRGLGVAPGDRVAIKLTDSPDWVCAYLGTIWAGGVAVAVNPRIPASEWQYILDEAGFSAILAEASDDTPAPWRERVILPDAWRRAVAAAQPLPAVAMDPEAPAFWCHSSGTSGKPKAVVHAQRFARAIEQVSRDGLGIRADDRLYASSKLFFAYPHTNSLCAGLKLGATVVLDPQWPTAQGVVATVEAQRPTVLLSVPSLYRNLLHEGLAPRIARAGVRLCVSAGEALPPSLRQAWLEQTGLAIVNGYGASEVLILVMLDHGDAQGLVPSPGVEIRPLDSVPEGVPTRLAIAAPTVALGYLDRPQAQAETFRDGAFCPADLFARVSAGPPQADTPPAGGGPATPSPRGPVASGGWRFAGREDSLVKISGRWVNLVDLEEQLAARLAGVAEAAAVCVPDGDGVDAVALFFVAGDAAAAGAALRQRAEALPHHQRPRWLHAVAELPRTATGKLQRRKLQELHRALE